MPKPKRRERRSRNAVSSGYWARMSFDSRMVLVAGFIVSVLLVVFPNIHGYTPIARTCSEKFPARGRAACIRLQGANVMDRDYKMKTRTPTRIPLPESFFA